ncbi:MAG TPA: XRE family transcriptional regulator, partial [Sulfurovum sp.]|nr:XRE family transcriptional regulator [Sulfurovum sp.]
MSNNVKKARTQHNKPQLDLVLEMGMKSTSFYSKCENAKENHHFNLEHLIKISKILGVGMEV